MLQKRLSARRFKVKCHEDVGQNQLVCTLVDYLKSIMLKDLLTAAYSLLNSLEFFGNFGGIFNSYLIAR